jgi:hypothetical protein
MLPPEAPVAHPKMGHQNLNAAITILAEPRHISDLLPEVVSRWVELSDGRVAEIKFQPGPVVGVNITDGWLTDLEDPL